MSIDDPLPRLVADFVQSESKDFADKSLLEEFKRHVSRVASPYPDAYFALGRKNPDAVTDLANRAFTSCARTVKGRHPFAGRVPFKAFVEEDFEGRAIRYHSFYARLSITRELLRDDYARNINRDPVLRWRADLYRQVGVALRAQATPVDAAKGPTTRWRLTEQGIALARSTEQVTRLMRDRLPCDVPGLVRAALELGGPATRAQITVLVEATLGTPNVSEPETGVQSDPATSMLVREAVLRAWNALERSDRVLLLALAQGKTYDELIEAHPEFQHRVALTRAVTRLGQRFVTQIEDAMGRSSSLNEPPRALVERVMEVLLEVAPELEDTQGGDDR
jgi:hypothetical protein